VHHTELEYQYYLDQEVMVREEYREKIVEAKYKEKVPHHKIFCIKKTTIDEKGSLKLSFRGGFFEWYLAEYFIPLNEVKKLESKKKIEVLPHNQLVEAVAEAIFQSEQKERNIRSI